MSEPSPELSTPEAGGVPPCEVDLLLTNISWLVPCGEGMQSFRSGALAIDGPELLAVGPTAEVRRHFRGRNEMDLSGFLVLPGLINTHTHAAMSCFRGLADDLPLLRWLHDVIFPAEAAGVNPEMVYRGTLLSCVEMLKNGITTFCDGYFFEEAAVQAARDCGMRAILGQGVLDFPTPDQPDPSRSRERVETFLECLSAKCRSASPLHLLSYSLHVPPRDPAMGQGPCPRAWDTVPDPSFGDCRRSRANGP